MPWLLLFSFFMFIIVLIKPVLLFGAVVAHVAFFSTVYPLPEDQRTFKSLLFLRTVESNATFRRLLL